MNIGILLLASMLVYPIFAEDKIEGEQPIVTEEIDINNEVKDANIRRTSVKATEFVAKIYNNGVLNLDCKFNILTEPSDGKPGTVETAENGCIDKATQGTIAFPKEVSFGTDTYVISSIGAYSFSNCTGITNTGLENNDTITSLGSGAYEHCERITSTGLETNSTVTAIKSSAFSVCSSLVSTGLESNNTVTSIENDAFSSCTSLTSTGLERNTSVKDIDGFAFFYCINLKDIIFETTKLPTIGMQAFGGTGVKIYYLSGTENYETLNNVGAASVGETALTGIQVQATPTKVEYVEGEIFNLEGLIVASVFSAGVGQNIVYNDSTKDKFSFDKTELSLGVSRVSITYNGHAIDQAIKVKKRKS